MTASSAVLSLHERVMLTSSGRRTVDLLILFLLVYVVLYRFFNLHLHGASWVLALLCESWFTLVWVLVVNAKWTPSEFRTYPERLLQSRSPELPAVDMFVTTADPVLEPPIITVNTVLSLLAADYIPEKLACYVSDDAASAITFFSLTEAVNFAKVWVPFCKKHRVTVRSPFRYFSARCDAHTPNEFQSEWKTMKIAYEQLHQKIDHASQSGLVRDCESFRDIHRNDHAPIIKVIWDNNQIAADGVPHLVYISREKRPNHPHHYKAGAMNVLTRVSGTMTNAPIMLNVDCDMYAHNPQVILHAMCLLLGFPDDADSGFVQFPQSFYGGSKDEPVGNHLLVLQNRLARGFDHIQGPLYSGTGCFHRRKCIYGSSPGAHELSVAEIEQNFGLSVELTRSAARILSKAEWARDRPGKLSSCLGAAGYVAECGYEHGTGWGTEIGWLYGSTTEDVLTGSRIHARGWASVYCRPNPPAFLGCVPTYGPAAFVQQKRWATGLLEILFSNNSPFITVFTTQLRPRQCLVYLWVLIWGLRSVPELCYALLPAYSIISNTPFIPSELMYVYFAAVVLYSANVLWDYLREGLSVRTWFNCQRACRIFAVTSWLFALFNVALKLLGLSDTVFDLTEKDATPCNGAGTALVFNQSPLFVPGATIAMANVVALLTALFGWHKKYPNGETPGKAELVNCLLVTICFSPFVRGLFAKGKYGLPPRTVWKSGILAFLFVQISRWQW